MPDIGADAPQGRVELRNVSFSHGDGGAVRNVNLTINPGEIPGVTAVRPRTIARLATVSQDVLVFSGTLRQDMTLARPDATDAELYSAFDRLHARSWSDRLDSGLDTVVGSAVSSWNRLLHSSWRWPASFFSTRPSSSWTKPPQRRAQQQPERWRMLPTR